MRADFRIAIAASLGFLEESEKQEQIAANEAALETLRQGMFAPCNRGKLVEKTEEGIDTAMHLLKSGYLTEEEIEKFPGVTRNKKIHPVIECVQNIPCNPCQDACPKHCIKIGSHITALPAVDPEVECIGCGLCVSSCSGQAIFLVQEECDEPGCGT